MALKANSLKSNDAQRKSIGKEVLAILSHIDDELKTAHEQGRHGIVTPLPITFSIPYMKNCDSQRIIYYKVLSSLLEREFTVEIELKQNHTFFHITWLTNDEMRELELQNALLAKHRKKDVIKIDLRKEKNTELE